MKTVISTILKDKGSNIISASPGDSIYDCVCKMNQEKVGALLILNEGKPVGIFTERDVTTKIVCSDLDIKSTQVQDVMTRELLVVSPDTSVAEAMAIITEKRLRHLPVMDSGKLLGLISSGDITKQLVAEQEAHIEHLQSYIEGDY